MWREKLLPDSNNLLLTIVLMLATVSMQAQKISHIEILLSGKSFTRRKIRLKSHKRVSASFVTLLVAKKRFVRHLE